MVKKFLFVLTIALVSLFLCFEETNANTYYIDPDQGDNSHVGTSKETAWKDIPGSYNGTTAITGSGWVQLIPGDTIKIKSGAGITNRLEIKPPTKGGQPVENGWYNNSPTGQPIRIERDTTWQSGNITFRGTMPDWYPVVWVLQHNIQIDGITERGIQILDSPRLGIIAGDRPNGSLWPESLFTEQNQMKGLTLKNLYVKNSQWFNLSLSCQDNFLLENVEVDGNYVENENRSGGVMIGEVNGGCSNGLLKNCKSYRHGALFNHSETVHCQCQGGGNNTFIGFWLVNSSKITYENCEAYENKGDGFDTGLQTPTAIITDSVNFINCRSHQNRGDGFGVNFEDRADGGKVFYLNCLSHDNNYTSTCLVDGQQTTFQCGTGWTIYSSVKAFVYNSMAANNMKGIYIDNWPTSSNKTKATLKNTIVYNSTLQNIEINHFRATPTSTPLVELDFDYNLYDRNNGGSVLVDWNDNYASDPSDRLFSLRYFFAGDCYPNQAPCHMDGYRNDRNPIDLHSHDSATDEKQARFTDSDFRTEDQLSGAYLTGVNLTSLMTDAQKWPRDKNNVAIPANDRDGKPRSQTDAWDRGAYNWRTIEPEPLSVTPSSLSFSGAPGGPFNPVGQGYFTLTDTGSTSLNWTSSSSENWATVTPPSGTINGGQSVQAAIGINSNANSLAPGVHANTVTFTNTGTGGTRQGTVNLTIAQPQCYLSVTPLETFSSTGPVGGPFSQSSKVYTLQNTGGDNCEWSASNSQNWVSLSPNQSGTLIPTQSTQVTVSINNQANSLGAGRHDDNVTFTSSGAGGGSVPVVLSIYSPSVYYIDPANGNDSNDGYTTATAWRHLPGSWDQSGSGYLTGSGWKTIQPGDILHIKSGTTISNKLYIDSNWYANGTSSQPIRIIRDTSWGSGQVIFDGTSQVIPDNDAMIFIISRNYVQIDGQGNAGSEAGIKIRKSSKNGLVAQGSEESNKMVGLTLKDIKFQNNGWWNLVLTRQDSFLVENVAVDGYQKDTENSGGVLVGGNPYSCSNGTFRNCQSYNNGNTPGTQQGGGARFGFWIMNSTNITFDKCTAYNNEGSGFVISPAGASPTVVWDNIKLTNCLAYNNANGFTITHYDTASGGNAYFTNCISRNNASKGWAIDSGAHATLYNCVASRNGLTGAYLDTGAGVFSTRDTIATIKNSIFYGNTTNSIYAHNCQDLQVVMDYNLFDRGTTGGTTMIQWDDAAGRETYHKVYYFSTNDTQNIRAWRTDKGQDAHSYDSTELGKHAYFVSSTDLHLQSTSDAINTGADLSAVWPTGIATTDMEGNTRPAGSGWDMGAYEYGS